MTVLAKNNIKSTLASNIDAVQTTFAVAAGDGALFPAPVANEYFYVTLINNANQAECMKCTNVTTDTLTVIRGVDGTTARAYTAGDTVRIAIPVIYISDAIDDKAGITVKDVDATTGYTVTKYDNSKMINITNAGIITFNALSTFLSTTKLYIKNNSVGNCPFVFAGTETFDGSTSYILNPGRTVVIVKGTTEWQSLIMSTATVNPLPVGYMAGLVPDLAGRSGTDVLTSWTNGGGGLGYDTFTAVGDAISSAINISSVTEEAFTNTFTAVAAGKRMYLITTLTLNSGTAPYVELVNSTGGRVSNIEQLSAGVNNIELVTFGTAVQLRIYNTANGNWSCTTASLEEPALIAGDEVAISAGGARSFDNLGDIFLNAEMIKDVTAPWAAGNKMGGMCVGSTLGPDGCYFPFVVSKADGTSDIMIDDNLTGSHIAATDPTYVYSKRRGFLLTDGSSNIIICDRIIELSGGQVYFGYSQAQLEATLTLSSTALASVAITAPIGIKSLVTINVYGKTIGNISIGEKVYGYVFDGDYSGTITNFPLVIMGDVNGGGAANESSQGARVQVLTDLLGQITWASSRSSGGDSAQMLLGILGITDLGTN